MRNIRRLLVASLVLNTMVVAALAYVFWEIGPRAGRSVDALPAVLQKVRPAVVTLRIIGERKIPVEIKPRNAAAQVSPLQPEKETFRTGGSGVIVDARHGYILTNNHVVENATSIDVDLADGRHLHGRLLGRDVGTDLALIKIDATQLPSIVIGDSDAAKVGDVVVAVGNPFGLDGTATMGIVSAVMRTEIGHEKFEDYLQIDAQINSGNSGGALVNARGELIGINTVIAGGRGQASTIGFAIPINMAMSIKTEILAHGRMRRGATGLIVADLRHEEATTISDANSGAVVSRVLPNTAAASLGLKPGDIIIRAANKPVRSAAEYMTRVSMVPVGEEISLVAYSAGKRRQLSVKVEPLSLEPEKIIFRQQMGSIGGLAVGNILPGNPLYGNMRGAQVLEVADGSGAFAAGFEAGDVVVGVDGGKIVSVEELARRVEQTGLQYRVDIVRNGTPAWLRMNR